MFIFVVMRWTIELAYDGTSFFGWQIQPKQLSVQEAIERCLTKLNGTVPISIVGCGRTDTGVHASYYVAHFDTENEIDAEQWLYKLNKMLPKSIVLFSLQRATDDFHARFAATSRTYRYFFNLKKDPFDLFSLPLKQDVDWAAMQEACSFFLGKQDFTSLSKLHTDVKTKICTVTEAKFVQLNESKWYFEITADRFLRNMVRATVGTLLDVGYGNIPPEEIKTILEAKDRGAAKLSVPAHALFLTDVCYPEPNAFKK